MEIKTKLVKITWLKGITHGYGCGYIGLPEGHPWYGKDYDIIDASVHGGLTYSDWHVGSDEPDGCWWIGFDTGHSNDNMDNCNEEFCWKEIERLKQQALEVINEKN